MRIYRLQGVIRPRRAQVQNHTFNAKFTHVSSGSNAALSATILMNELAVTIETPDEWDIFTLRNVVRALTKTELALIGYLTGHAYSVEIVRVECDDPKTDVVYGINIPVITDRPRAGDFQTSLARLKQLCIGEAGAYVRRCMDDLMLAIQQPEDMAFFCYRAIEALKNHASQSEPSGSASSQWERFRTAAGCTRAEIDFVKDQADPLRHSSDLLRKHEDLDAILTRTWSVVEGYVNHLLAALNSSSPTDER